MVLNIFYKGNTPKIDNNNNTVSQISEKFMGVLRYQCTV